MRAVRVVGGGPAGVMAGFAAMREGAGVRILEKSAFPRHKVCGEFLSPAILLLLRRAGCEAGFLQLRPAVLSAMRLHFGTRVIRHPLPEPEDHDCTTSPDGRSSRPSGHRREVLHANPEGLSNLKAVVAATAVRTPINLLQGLTIES